jgi:hypothetical protein
VGLESCHVDTAIVTPPEKTPARRDTHRPPPGMAKAMATSQTGFSRIWRTFRFKPHLVDTSKLSKDPKFIEKVRDVVGLHLVRRLRHRMLCVDEMSGAPVRRPHGYISYGTTSLR